MDKDTKDTIMHVICVFTNPKCTHEFIDGLTIEQYAALRDLNVLRMEFDETTYEEFMKSADRKKTF